MKFNVVYPFILFGLLVILSSCDKGYEVRFTNYYIEPMDSVVVGNNAIVFKNVELQKTTDFTKLSKGTYQIRLITTTKKRFYTSLTIPKTGTGKRTIQIDAITQMAILEE
ncbi:MAG: hypothetical protein PSX36_16060 [bacterium]|nr:hypothetical protein [bacterium]